MTTLDNLRTRKLELEQNLAQGLSEEHREQIEGELIKIDIALSFLDDGGHSSARPPTQKPPLA
jgi:hypothetical protein